MNDEFTTILDKISKLRKEYNGPKFLNIPDEWFETPHWYCNNGHVNSMYLKSEVKGALCLKCQESVMLGPKELPVRN
jgi:hypothetical protein